MKKLFLFILLLSFYNANIQVKQNSAQKTAELFIIQIYVQESIRQKQMIFKKLILNFVK